MIVTPVINLSGNCEDAIHFYEHAFGTKANFILHYSDAKQEDWDVPLTEEQKTYVYHAEMHIGNQRFMFSDILEFDVITGNAFFINITFDTKEDVQQVYNILSQESTGGGLNPLTQHWTFMKLPAIQVFRDVYSIHQRI